jgi:hypothetical protein
MQERAYHFMSAIAGDLPAFRNLIAAWPEDIKAHVPRLLSENSTDLGKA